MGRVDDGRRSDCGVRMNRAVLLALMASGCAIPVDVGGRRPCASDLDCAYQQLCIAGSCVGCPEVSCTAPLNLAPLLRNGCNQCDFAPPSLCNEDAGCRAMSLLCVQGERCAKGCTRSDCCANSCVTAGCPGKSQLGCNMQCSSLQPGCTTCVAIKCSCGSQGWDCTPGCTDPGFDAGCVVID